MIDGLIPQLDGLRGLSMASVSFRFLLCFLFSGTVGLERGWRQQAAGLRTHMLVCLGAASTLLVGEYSYIYFSMSGDFFRISAQVVSGIGFLGAGTIIVNSRHQIKGLTTAASLWATACLGLTIGAGFYECAFLLFLMLVFVLIVINRFDNKYLKVSTSISVYLEIRREVGLGELIRNVKAMGWDIQNIKEYPPRTSDVLVYKIDMASEQAGKKDPEQMLRFRRLEGIVCFEEL